MNPLLSFVPAPFTADFWQQIASNDALAECSPLEKILAGCEIIAAADEVDLLAA